MKRQFLSLLVAVAVMLTAASNAAAAGSNDQRVKNAVMTLIKAETRADGLYHIEDKYHQQKLALKFDGLEPKVQSEQGLQVVTARFKDGAAQHKVKYFVSSEGGDTGAPVQVTRFVLDNQEVPSGQAYDKRPTSIYTTRRGVPGTGVYEERTEPGRPAMPAPRTSMDASEQNAERRSNSEANTPGGTRNTQDVNRNRMDAPREQGSSFNDTGSR